MFHAVIGACMKYWINEWYNEFYDLLETASSSLLSPSLDLLSGENVDLNDVTNARMRDVYYKLWEFAWLVFPMCIVHPVVKYLRAHWSFAWRLALMKAYIDKWRPQSGPVEGAAQRVHEDTQRFSSGLNGCMVVVLDAVCTLVVFVPVLLDIGSRVRAPDWLEYIDGAWILCLAAGSALLGLFVASIVGRKLIGLEVNNQVVEARLRRELVLLETASSSVYRSSSRTSQEDDVDDGSEMSNPSCAFAVLWIELKFNYGRMFANFMSLNVWLETFEQYMVLVPYLAAAPLLFAPGDEKISLGTLVQFSNSFGKVFSGLNIVADNWGAINEFCSCVVRLRQFERSVGMWVSFTESNESSSSSSSRTHNALKSGQSVLVAHGHPRSNDQYVCSGSGRFELNNTSSVCVPRA
jgi:peptide/bleomycin uptake transporter